MVKMYFTIELYKTLYLPMDILGSLEEAIVYLASTQSHSHSIEFNSGRPLPPLVSIFKTLNPYPVRRRH